MTALRQQKHVKYVTDLAPHVVAQTGEVGHHMNIHPVLHQAVDNVNHKQYITNKDRY